MINDHNFVHSVAQSLVRERSFLLSIARITKTIDILVFLLKKKLTLNCSEKISIKLK